MMRSVRYYNDRRWLPENLDYSKLLRGCLEESVTHTLLVKASKMRAQAVKAYEKRESLETSLVRDRRGDAEPVVDRWLF